MTSRQNDKKKDATLNDGIMMATTGRTLHLIQTNRYHRSGSWIDVALCMKVDTSRGTRKLEAVVRIEDDKVEFREMASSFTETSRESLFFQAAIEQGHRYRDYGAYGDAQRLYEESLELFVSETAISLEGQIFDVYP